MAQHILSNCNKYMIVVDDDVLPLICNYNWIVQSQPGSDILYAKRYVPLPQCGKGPRRYNSILMHREIMGLDDDMYIGGLQVDHINRCGLDNRKSNLRIVGAMTNAYNQRKAVSYGGHETSSKFKGVCYIKQNSKWLAYINADKKRINIGSFSTEHQAARAYDTAAIKLHGEHARTNKQMGLYNVKKLLGSGK